MITNFLDKIIGGRFVTHAHDDKNWRLRDMTNHPRDPNWENGEYAKCHEDFRLNLNLKPNTFVFDLVKRKENKFPVIRSAFLIRDIINGVIHFDSFIFADGEPKEIDHNLFRTRYGEKLTKDQCTLLLSKLDDESYHYYKVGEKPQSINGFDWERMKMVALQSKTKIHKCSWN